ncbi:MAG: SPFH domain-containing protein [Anaerolineae bacterium]|jgi:hypothetical protein|nr:SPFH domain-containing protein [Anaerolineae bacterium]
MKLLVPLIVGSFFLAFAASLPLALWSDAGYVITSADAVNFFVLVGGFGVALSASALHVLRALRQYTQAVHDLAPADADELVTHLVFGSETYTSVPGLRVQAGRLDLDGPPIAHSVGGPARLSIDLHNVVVTSQLGKLHRILGAGLHTLAPFERVWDVVDLRPQRRTVTVGFVTRDGIPATCQVSIVCRVAPPGYITATDAGALPPGPPFSYDEDAVLKVATAKRVRGLEGNNRVSDWITAMASDVLEREVRDTLERYRLDEFLNPQYWLGSEEGPPRTAAVPRFIPDLEAEIGSAVRSEARRQGIVVERLELGTVRPAEAAISRQWLEFWQAKLQAGIDRYTMEAEAANEQVAEAARFEAQAMFVNRMFEEVQRLRSAGLTIPPQLVIASFIEVLHSMSESDPAAQQMLLQQADSLLRVVNAIRDEGSPFRDVDTPKLPSHPEAP